MEVDLEPDELREARGTVQFERDIFPLELARIAERQERVFGAAKPPLKRARRAAGTATEAEPPVVPSTDLCLMGLALSGGGIRSATFNLGVVQALNQRGMLRHVDYVSTVSGGGYLGACLSSVLNHARPRLEELPFGEDSKGRERKAIRYLRNNSNYLAPGGLLDLVRIPALLLRGILLNFLVLLPYVIAAVWLTDIVWGRTLRAAYDKHEIATFYRFTPWAVLAFLLYVVVSPMLQKRIRGGFGLRNWYERSFGFLLLAAAGVALLETLPTLLSIYDYHISEYYRGHWTWIARGIKGLHDSTWAAALASLAGFLTAGRASANVAKLRGKIVLLALGILGPLVMLLVYLYLAEWGIFNYPPPYFSRLPWLDFSDMLEPLLGHKVGAGLVNVSAVAVLVLAWSWRYVDVNRTSLHSFYRDRLSRAYLFKVERDEDDRISQNDAEKLSSLNGDASIAPYHLINAALNLQASKDPELRGRNADFFYFSRHFVGSDRTGYCRTENIEKVDDHLNLGTAMAISGAAAAPNMGSTTIRPLVFIMTLLNVRLGYWLPNPRHVHERRNALLLRTGVGPLYLLAEMFSLIDEDSRYVNVTDGGHIENLGIYELLRRRCKFIIASDAEADAGMNFGGLATVLRYARIDLGIEIDLELDDLRRGPDGFSRKHSALGKIRYPKTPTCDAETGHLLYIKSSISGSENEYIREYRSRNVDFPHETTADQFFNEAQFEAYRALGQAVGRSLFPELEDDEAGMAVEAPEDPLAAWFERLSDSLRPRFDMPEKLAGLQEQLAAIERATAAPALAAYSYEIYPEIDPARAEGGAFAESVDPRIAKRGLAAREGEAEPGDGQAPEAEGAAEAEAFRQVFHLVRQQLQLMEAALVELRLDRESRREHHFNRGWMNLFRRWAQAASFRRAWAVAIGTCSATLQRFCEEELRLRSEICWREGSWASLTSRERRLIAERGLAEPLGGDAGAGGDAGDRGEPDPRYRIWMAHLRVAAPATAESATASTPGELHWEDSFPVGCVVLRFSTAGEGAGRADLVFYRIRDFYRQMGLFERMLESLVREAKRKGPKTRLRVPFARDEEDLRRRYAYVFERHGIAVRSESPLAARKIRKIA